MAFDPGQYPRTYRTSAGWRWFYLLLGGGIAVAGLTLALGYWLNFPDDHALGMMLGIGFFMAALGSYLFSAPFVARVELTADAIVVREPLMRARSIRRDQIAGLRAKISAHGSELGVILVPNRPDVKPVTIEVSFDTDEAFTDWLSDFPDLDANEEKASEEAIASDPELGSTPSERLGKLASAKRVAGFLQLAAIALGAALIYYPSPNSILLACAVGMPWAAIVLVRRSNGLYRLASRRSAPNGDLSILLFLPGLALAASSLKGLQLLHWEQGAMASVIVAAALVFAARAADPLLRPLTVANVVVYLFLLPYGFGASALVDVQLDRSTPERFRAVVEESHVSRGRRSSTPRLTLAPWGPQREAQDVRVSWVTYRSVVRGDTVCVGLHAGAIRVPWYEVSECR